MNWQYNLLGGVNVSILVKKHASKFDKNDLANLWNCTELKNDFISKIDKVQLIGLYKYKNKEYI